MVEICNSGFLEIGRQRAEGRPSRPLPSCQLAALWQFVIRQIV